jgi:hypothetical protein
VTPDIADLLADAVDERARSLGDLRPTPAAFALTRVRIRRRRIVRHSTEAGVGIAASGVVAAGVWFGTHVDRTPTPPIQSPTTSVAPTPTPSPTPSPTSEPTTSAPPTAIPTATTSPGLPAALPAPDGLLATTGPGWVLTVYRSTPAGSTTAGANAVIAVAPDGTLYRLADLSADQNVELLDWHTGDTRAYVSYGPGSLFGWLDLRTGALTRDEPAVPAGHTFEARLNDGTTLWTTNLDAGPVQLWAVANGGAARLVGQLGDFWTKPQVSPSQTRVAALAPTADSVLVLELSTGQRRTVSLAVPDGQCALLGWLDDSTLLTWCFDHSGPDPIVQRNPRLVSVDVDTGTLTVLAKVGVGQPLGLPGAVGVHVGPGAVAFPARTLDAQIPMADVCSNSVWEWAGGALRRTTLPEGSDTFRLAAAGGDLYVAASAGCAARIAPPTLDRVAPSGDATTLTPAPAPLAGVDTTTALSWVVGR